MLSFAFKFLVSVLLFNWICAELDLAAPKMMELGQQITEAAAIPTHDKWKLNVTSFDDLGSWFARAEQEARRAYEGHAPSGFEHSREVLASSSGVPNRLARHFRSTPRQRSRLPGRNMLAEF